jgi:NAD(P)-dependent dehydrogenase (short-subunit alcohol dehydrogenase family)
VQQENAMTLQHPLPSGFGPASTAEDVSAGMDLSGKTAVVTGGYSGIGLETARVLALRGARVIVPVRDPAKAEAALSSEALGGLRVESLPMDLMDRASIDAFASRVLDRVGKRLRVSAIGQRS